MQRRPFLRALATGGTLLTAGCSGSLPFAPDSPDPDDVFEGHRFDGTDLVVRLRAGVDARRVSLFDSADDETYATRERPSRTVRFPVVFPDRMETYVANSLHVRVETPDGTVERWIPEVVHGHVETVDPLGDGRARFAVENQGEAPLLVRFVGVYGDVPNPTVDPQREGFERAALGFDPGVVGVGPNRPLSSSRTDLVVSPGEAAPFETTYAPFAFTGGGDPACDGAARTGKIAVVHASGGSASYSFTYRLDGDATSVEGHDAAVCGGER